MFCHLLMKTGPVWTNKFQALGKIFLSRKAFQNSRAKLHPLFPRLARDARITDYERITDCKRIGAQRGLTDYGLF